MRRLAKALLGLLPLLASPAAPNVRAPEYRRYLGWVRDLRIGGLVLVNRVEGAVAAVKALEAGVDVLLMPAGRAFAQEVLRRAPRAPVFVLEPSAPEVVFEQAAACGTGLQPVAPQAGYPLGAPAPQADLVVVAAFASVAAYRGNVALAGGYPALMERLIGGGKRVVLVALGNPYLLRSFPVVSAYLATFSTVVPSEIVAVKALFGKIAIQGRLPVTIPGQARLGDGLKLAVAARP